MTKKLPYLLILIIFLIVSCFSNSFFEDYHSLNPTGWDKDSLACFDVNVTDTTTAYDLYINVRNLGDYPYSNLWLFINIVAPDSSSIRDTVEYQLAFPNGKWKGKGNNIYYNKFPLRENVNFPLKGNYTFTISQAMRTDVLKGLNNIGLRVEKR